MLWIPVVFLCTTSACFFLSGPAEYSEAACMQALVAAEAELQQADGVLRYALDCVTAIVS